MSIVRFGVLSSVVLLVAFAWGACGDDDAQPDPTPDGGAGVAPRPVDDEGYLAAICTGTDAFSDALLTSSTAEEIAEVIEQYIADLEAISPPQDLQSFHAEFIQYLEDSLEAPTRLLTVSPPLPDEDVRQRLVAKESSVPECEAPTFFSREPEGEE